VSANAIVELMVVPKMTYTFAGFHKLRKGLNPDAQTPQPKKFLIYQTREAKRKIDHLDYEKGDRVDCYDVSKWRTTTIIETKMGPTGIKEIKVHFEGWSSSYDIWHRVNSPKIAPIYFHTKGQHTGGAAKPAFALADNMEQFEEYHACLRAMVEQKEPLSETDFTFMQEDGGKFLKDLFGASVADELQDTAANYLDTVAQVYVKILRTFEGDVSVEILAGLGFLLNEDSGPSMRGFFKMYGTTRDHKPKVGDFAGRKSATTTSAYLINLINSFGAARGFELIADRLNAFIDPNRPEIKSFVVVAHLIQVVSNLKAHLKKSFAQAFAKQVDLQKILVAGLEN
jgi:hypothetical protein